MPPKREELDRERAEIIQRMSEIDEALAEAMEASVGQEGPVAL